MAISMTRGIRQYLIAAALDKGQAIIADSEADAMSMFAEGKAVMTIACTDALSGFSELYPDFGFDIAPFPAGPVGSVSVIGCKYISLSVNADMSAASDFLDSVFSSDAIMKADPRFPAPEAALAYARPLPASYSMQDMDNEFILAMKQVTEGYKTTKEALDGLAMVWDAYLL